MATATLPPDLRDRVIAQSAVLRNLTFLLICFKDKYREELSQYRPLPITVAIDETNGNLHFVLRVDGEWVSSAWDIGELEEQLNDRLWGSRDVLDVESTVLLGGLENYLERIDNFAGTPCFRVVVADMF
jgi:hypothetical protein